MLVFHILAKNNFYLKYTFRLLKKSIPLKTILIKHQYNFMFRYTLIIFLVTIFSSTVSAKYDYILNNNLKTAYQKINQLRFNEAKAILAEEHQANPENLMVDFIEDYIDFYTLLVNGSSSLLEQLSPNKDKRMKRFENGPILSPYHIFVKAEVQMHWGMINGVYGDQLTAFRELRNAYKILQTNQKQFPDFMPNYKSLGTLRTIFSAIPDNYKWSAKALGVNGNFNQGYREITKALNYAKSNEFIFEEELRIIYSYVLLSSTNDKDKAWRIINHSSVNTNTSLLATIMKGDIAMRVGKNETAINIYENAPKSSSYIEVPQIQYFLGLAKFRKLDQSATTHFYKYLNTKTNENYVKSTYLYLAWYNLIYSTDANYNKYINLCKSQGITKIYDDQKALKLAKTEPNKNLLKAELLIAGGYYSRASSQLAALSENSFSRTYDKLNFYYLKANAAHRQKKYPIAQSYYKKAIVTGTTTDYFQRCYSALQLASIYEEQKNNAEARKYYNICLKLKSDSNQSDYHMKAKQGLERVK